MLEKAQAIAEPASSAPLTTLLARISREQADYELAAGHTAEAIAAYHKALEHDPSLPLVYGSYDRALPPDQTFTRLTTILEERLAIPGPEHQQLTTLAARIYVEHGDHARAAGRVGEAIHAYERATTLVPFSGLVAVKYAVALAKAKQVTKAIAALESVVRVVRTDGEREQITRLLARLWIDQGDHELAVHRLTEAVSAYGQGLKLDPFLQPIYISRGITLAKLHQFRLAIGMLEELREQSVAEVITPQVPSLPALLATVVLPPSEADRIERVVSAATLSDPTVSIMGSPPLLANPDRSSQRPEPSQETSPVPQPLLVQVAREMTPPSLDFYRQGFIASGGFSLVDPSVRIDSLQKMLHYLPRGLALGLLAPFPWQWFDPHGSTGIMRSLAGIEVALIYLLLPGMVLGMIRLTRQSRIERYFFLVAVSLMVISMSLVVANLGTLFRLRLQFLLPLLLCAAAGRPLSVFNRALRWMTAHPRHIRFMRKAQGIEEDTRAEVPSAVDGN
jgi:cytochrome c-type biogenesis protein CcmH/NrfG